MFKKRLLVLLISILMIFTFAGCGGGGGSEAEPGSDAGTEEASSDYQKIEFDGVVLHEDDNIKVELMNFYEKEVNWADSGPAVEKYFTIKILNKSDRKMLIDLSDVYLGGEGVKYIYETGSPTPAPGKSVQSSFMIQREGQPDGVALDSLEELYDLEFTMGIMYYKDEDSLEQGYSFDVNFADVL